MELVCPLVVGLVHVRYQGFPERIKKIPLQLVQYILNL